MAHSNPLLLVVAVVEVAFDAVVSFRIGLPLIRQMPTARRELSAPMLKAEKIGLVIGGFVALGVLLLGFMFGLLYR